MHAPAALAAVPFLAGSAAALLLWPSLPPDLAIVSTGAAAIALLGAMASAAADDGPVATVSIAAGCLLAGLTLGAIASHRAYSPPLLDWFDGRGASDAVILEGVLADDAAASAYGVSLTMAVDRVDHTPTSGGVRLSVAGSLATMSFAEWRRGRRVRLPALLRYPTVYRNPGVHDEAKALARRGISLVGHVKSGALVELIENGSIADELASAARAWARRRLAAAIAPRSDRSAAIATAILIGDRSRLDDADERRLQEAGTYHVIAISGGNIAILTALLMLTARACRVPQPASAALTIAILLFYGEITGAAASVGRAITAAVIFLSARLIDRRGPPLNALAVAAVFAVARSPATALDPGFMLSFGATVGILLGVPVFLAPSARVRGTVAGRVLRFTKQATAGILAATVCAELVLAPVGASLFGRVTFAGLLLNFVAIPFMTVVQVGSMGILVVPHAWTAISVAPVRLVHTAASGLVESARLIDVAPWLGVRTGAPAWPMLVLYYAAVAAFLSKSVRRYAVPCVAAVLVLMLAGPRELARDAVAPSRYPLRVVVLDVGQGDATLVSVANRHAILVDAGGVASFSTLTESDAAPGFDVGERVVAPALHALGIARLEGLVVTHGDPDHILGAPGVLRVFDVRSVWEGVPVPRHPGLQAFAGLTHSAGGTWRTVQTGDRERFGDVEIRVLHPPPPEWERQRIRNDDSIVLEVRLHSVSIVLAGDIGGEGERAIRPLLERGRLAVLKAGHHGSATSSTPELLAALRPAAVVFSAGRDNRFGHPHPAVVERFDAIGSAVFRTDRDGAVLIETDGKTVEMRGWTGRALRVRALPAGAGTKTFPAGAGTKTEGHEDTKE